jgi:hypothetical protein
MGPEDQSVRGEGEMVVDAISVHFATFGQCHPDARRIIVAITLTNGDILEFDGLRIDRVSWSSDWVMIRGAADEPGVGVLIHEGSIYRAEFLADPPQERKFGFFS